MEQGTSKSKTVEAPALPRSPETFQPQPPSPTSAPTTFAANSISEKSGNSFGALVGIIIIIAVLLVGALYFWAAELSNEINEDAAPRTTGTSTF